MKWIPLLLSAGLLLSACGSSVAPTPSATTTGATPTVAIDKSQASMKAGDQTVVLNLRPFGLHFERDGLIGLRQVENGDDPRHVLPTWLLAAR